MIFIAHRGNLNGKHIQENHPEQINICLKQGYDVEIDVWHVKDKWYLGHDEPQHLIDSSFLLRRGLWCHAKNIEALDRLLMINAHCFWHQEDDVVLTSHNFMWTYTGKQLLSSSICVMPENGNYTIEQLKKCAGICSDNIAVYKNKCL